MSARRHVGRVRFSGIVRALQDGLGPAAVARRFDVARSVVERAAEAYGIDLVAADAAEVAEREAAREAKASAMEQARAAREAVRQAARAKRKADAMAARDARVAAKVERDRKAADDAFERAARLEAARVSAAIRLADARSAEVRERRAAARDAKRREREDRRKQEESARLAKIARAAEMRAAGCTLRAIGAALGVSYETARQMTKDKE